MDTSIIRTEFFGRRGVIRGDLCMLVTPTSTLYMAWYYQTILNHSVLSWIFGSHELTIPVSESSWTPGSGTPSPRLLKLLPELDRDSRDLEKHHTQPGQSWYVWITTHHTYNSRAGKSGSIDPQSLQLCIKGFCNISLTA